MSLFTAAYGSMAPTDRTRDLRDHFDAIIARCEASPDPRAVLTEQLRLLRIEFACGDLARMYREAVRRLNLGA